MISLSEGQKKSISESGKPVIKLLLGVAIVIAVFVPIMVYSDNHYVDSVDMVRGDKVSHFTRFDQFDLYKGQHFMMVFDSSGHDDSKVIISTWEDYRDALEVNGVDPYHLDHNDTLDSYNMTMFDIDEPIRYTIPIENGDFGFFIVNKHLSETQEYRYRFPDHPEINLWGSEFITDVLLFSAILFLIVLFFMTKLDDIFFFNVVMAYILTFVIFLENPKGRTVMDFFSFFGIVLVIVMNINWLRNGNRDEDTEVENPS